MTFSENTAMRFAAQGWHVIEVADVNDLDELKKAITEARDETERPSIIICHSTIGYGTPLAGSAVVHGTPLTSEQLMLTKEYLNWTELPFEVPAAVNYHCMQAAERDNAAKAEWQEMLSRYKKQYPELAKEYDIFFAKAANVHIAEDICNCESPKRRG